VRDFIGISSMADTPIVDFAKATSGTPNEKTHIASQIDKAFRTVGFVYLKNHGVPREKVEECFDWVSHGIITIPQSKHH
jgi:isopenicillin N synthase-like dioxygenase